MTSTVKWAQIIGDFIVRRRNKTGARLEIPILPAVSNLLAEHSEDAANALRQLLSLLGDSGASQLRRKAIQLMQTLPIEQVEDFLCQHGELRSSRA